MSLKIIGYECNRKNEKVTVLIVNDLIQCRKDKVLTGQGLIQFDRAY